MNARNINDRLAPCGLNCGKCFAYKKGDIAVLSNKFAFMLFRIL